MSSPITSTAESSGLSHPNAITTEATTAVAPGSGTQSRKRQSSPESSNDRAKTRHRRSPDQSCTSCKRQEVRCDRERPACGQCRRWGKECVYLDTKEEKPKGSTQSTRYSPVSSYSPPKVDSNSFSVRFRSGNITPPPLPFRDDSPPKSSVISIEYLSMPDSPLYGTIEYRNEYVYSHIGPQQVRLLLLPKGRYEEAIHCSLKAMDFSRLEDSQLMYQALSYAWGDDVAKHELFLQDINISAEGQTLEEYYRLAAAHAVPKRFYIKSNLHQALKRLRSETTDLWLWIDAVCINQEDDVEKSHQLGKLLGIYTNAFNVCIWLGESDGINDKGHDAMDFIPNIVNLKLLDRMVAKESPDDTAAVSWIAFANLLRRPWFRRRWVIQEVASSRRASVQCGKRSINWIDFADAVQLFMTKLERIRAIYDSSEASKLDPDALTYVESVGATAIVNNTSNVLRKAESGTILDRLWNIESLVMTFLHFEASDPRDTIFALLSLARDGHLSPRAQAPRDASASLVPDYTKTTLQVYIEFVQHCIASGGSLDIICRHWALPLSSKGKFWEPSTQIPSWIGLVKDSPFGPPSRFTGRLNGDSLVGDPGHSIYNASRGRKPELYFEKEVAMASEKTTFTGILFVKGIILSRVSRVSSRVVDGTISDDCLGMAGWESQSDVNNIPDRLWRTLVADRTTDGKSAPFWYRRACMHCLNKASPDGDLNTSKLIANRSLPETVIEYLRRVQSVVWSRKFMVCRDSKDQSEWLFGLGSRYVQEGDLVCILFGCSVPVVLRKVENWLGDRSRYELVGECFIFGMMDGEALAGLSEESIVEKTVELSLC